MKHLGNLVDGEIKEKDYYSGFTKRMNDTYEKLEIEN
tara:strand:- start:226 stop:336 length:111 start_codon:yes stop_codon:yes gene_type:complete